MTGWIAGGKAWIGRHERIVGALVAGALVVAIEWLFTWLFHSWLVGDMFALGFIAGSWALALFERLIERQGKSRFRRELEKMAEDQVEQVRKDIRAEVLKAGGGMQWFGESWGSEVNYAVLKTNAPAGQPCLHCEELIAENDSGVLMWCVPMPPKEPAYRPLHHECWVRMGVGSVGHLEKRCSCHGGDEEDPPDMTKRQAAVAATNLFYSQMRQRAGTGLN